MGWIIAGAVIAFIMILLMTSVKVRFEYSDDLRLKINWFFITFVSIPAKTKKQKRRNKKAERDAETAAKDTAQAEESADSSGGEAPVNSESTPHKVGNSGSSGAGVSGKKKSKSAPKSQKLTLSDIWELVKLVWDSLNTPLRRMLKATRVSGFELNIVCGGDDAAKAALNYGRTSAVAGAAEAFLEGCFTMKKTRYSVSVDFMSEETTTECVFTARLTLIAALAFLFWVVGRLVRNYLSRKDAARAVDKLRS